MKEYGRKMSETCFKMQIIQNAGLSEPHWEIITSNFTIGLGPRDCEGRGRWENEPIKLRIAGSPRQVFQRWDVCLKVYLWDPLSELLVRLDAHQSLMLNQPVLWGFRWACALFLQSRWWWRPELWSSFSSMATAHRAARLLCCFFERQLDNPMHLLSPSAQRRGCVPHEI